ncbi:hypothetical protein CPB86DRAFT_701206 [Serendipita vermifera]|nr:hypothetical protein CPB86DRAFT_701206 [Serendipita vermifera]
MDLDFPNPRSGISTDEKFHIGNEEAYSPSLPPPRLSRAFSLPASSELGHLQRPKASTDIEVSPDNTLSDVVGNNYNNIAVELADLVQMVIQTLLQISPPHLLDPVREQLSGCTLQVPTPSVSALFTSMKMLNYISKNMVLFTAGKGATPASSDQSEFDIGELLQTVGDALSGIAAENAVDLVIFQADTSLKDLVVRADECALTYALCSVASQILTCASPGDVLEIGMRLLSQAQVTSQSTVADHAKRPILCTFEIKHKCLRTSARREKDSKPVRPAFDNAILRALLGILDAELRVISSDNVSGGRGDYELLVPVDRGHQAEPNLPRLEEDAVRQPFPDLQLAREPTVSELLDFAKMLKGRKATFHASTRSSFAHYLTIYLTGWGMDVTHLSSDGDGLATLPPDENNSHPGENVSIGVDVNSIGPDERSEETHQMAQSDGTNPAHPFFTIIDDNVNVLKEKLNELQVPISQIFHDNLKRPSLAAHHRPKSSALVRRAIFPSGEPAKSSTSSALVYFTSLSSYREVKDVVQAVTTLRIGKQPEIIVIPKPAGVRRFLTALYTAIKRPLVDPAFFSPIATSPMSPGTHSPPSLAKATQSPRTSSAMLNTEPVPEPIIAALSSGTPTPIQALATSPLAGGSYFESKGNKVAGSASSGLLVKSPDGRTGIFFQPLAGEGDSEVSTGDTKSLSPGPSSHRTFRETIDSLKDKSRENTSEDKSRRKSNIVEKSSSTTTQPQSNASTPTSQPTAMDLVISTANSVFERGPIVPKPSKPLKASIVGAKVTKQAEVVPPISVLIVEDNSIQRTVLSTFMKNKHISYGIAVNGQDAVERWSNGDYHLVLMDIQMPVMDGIEATKRIREIESARHRALSVFTPSSEGARTPTSTISTESQQATTPFHSSVIIVALTAQASPQDRVTALAAGCNDFLSKPVKLQWLERKIIEWGSIKALQMWADPEVEPVLRKRQQANAQAVADNLRIVRPHGRSSAQTTEKP